MRNPHAARLDRTIRLHGERVELLRIVGGAQHHDVEVATRGIVRTFAVEQLVGGVSQTNFLVILSPTLLRRNGWPGGRGVTAATIPDGIGSQSNPLIPLTTDKVIIRGAQKAITRVDAKYDGDELVRIEISIIG